MKKLVTTVQITLAITHDEDLAPSDVVILAGDIARDAIVWTDNTRLSRATEDVKTPVEIVSATALSSRAYEEKSS